MFKLDVEVCGGNSRNDWCREGRRVLSQSLWKAKGGGCHSAWLGKKQRAHWVIFAPFPATWIEKPSPGSMHHSWGWEQNPSLFPSETYLWRAAQLPVRYRLQMCHGRPAWLCCHHSKCKNGHFVLLDWKWLSLLWSPLGFPSGQNFLLRGGAVSSGCVCDFVLFLCEFV